MSQVTSHQGTGIALVGNDIDTDRIIPARFLRCVTFDGLGENVFADDRHQANQEHPFDHPKYQTATILVVNRNFGCGSSREHAPQALIKWGIKAIVGESFAEIFFGNCLANGVACVTAAPEDIATLQAIIQGNPQQSLHLDLVNCQLTCGDQTFTVSLPEGAQKMLVKGEWDSCGQLLQNQQQILSTAGKIPYLHWAKKTLAVT